MSLTTTTNSYVSPTTEFVQLTTNGTSLSGHEDTEVITDLKITVIDAKGIPSTSKLAHASRAIGQHAHKKLWPEGSDW